MVGGDDSSHCSCHTERRCCQSIRCEAFPLNLTFFWFYQFTFVCRTALFHWGYVLFLNPMEEKKEEHDKRQLLGDGGHGQDRPPMQDGEGKVHISRARLQLYVISIVLTILSELGLVAGQNDLCGFGLKPQYPCDYPACPTGWTASPPSTGRTSSPSSCWLRPACLLVSSCWRSGPWAGRS